jgi:hypothetical protein
MIYQRVKKLLLSPFLFILYAITMIVPKTLFELMFYEWVECQVCKRKMYRRRGWKKIYPQELLDLPIKCEDCCSPKEILDRERLADKYLHII